MRKLTLLLLICASCGTIERHDDGVRESANLTLNQMYERGIQARMAKDADACLRDFQNIVELRKGVQGTLYVYSLYQSGLCYEMKNQTDQAIAVYQDALRITGIVPAVFYELEVPSRLAICYSRLGEQAVAEQYYNQSKKYLQQLEKNKKEIAAHREQYAEILYEMGLITNDFQKGTDFTSYIKSIQYAQEYLTLSMELNVEPYSKYASQQLLDHFQTTYNYIVQFRPETTEQDPLLAARQVQAEKKRLSSMLLNHMDQFREFIKTKRQIKNTEYAPILAELDTLQVQLEKIIAERPIGEGLTPEAQKLQNPKKNGNFAPVPGEEEK